VVGNEDGSEKATAFILQQVLTNGDTDLELLSSDLLEGQMGAAPRGASS